ncbi:MAG: hypothetical protein M1823_005785 [Watsoniomyces obsoletus]|nr:MAG: hypothetical protein M1823_005785 [Watsoniomyces obsoletus]
MEAVEATANDALQLAMSGSSEDDALLASADAGPRGSNQSPSAVEHIDVSQITLEKLLDYLLASKRSLSATEQVWRANTIVHSAREALVEAVELRARSEFLKDGITSQLKILSGVKSGIEGLAKQDKNEFRTTLWGLDDVIARLRETVELLRSTPIEPALRPPGDEQRTLHDFVDEDGVEMLKAGLQECVARRQAGHDEFDKILQQFDSEIQAVRLSLEIRPAPSSSGGGDALREAMPSILQTLESHAQEMAALLESLVQHFDLCVTALKHTEGGGAAAQNITNDLPTDVNVQQDDRSAAPLEPISDEDRTEMLTVLAKDAAELEDVVLEIRDRLGEMEAQSEDLTSHMNELAAANANTSTAFDRLEEAGSHLSDYIRHGEEFQKKWDEQKRQIDERMEEMENLREFYHGFLTAYDGLLIEVGRRREAQKRMEMVVRDAMTKLDQIYHGTLLPFHILAGIWTQMCLSEDDLAEREAFRLDQGDFLPSDIWAGLMDAPIQFEFNRIDTETRSIPEIPRAVLEQAARRQRRKL